MPWTPCKSLNPFKGTREVPVAKLRTLALSSRLNDFNARHHQTITGSELVYPLYSVAARHSSTSMSGVPEIRSSSSCSLNCAYISWLGQGHNTSASLLLRQGPSGWFHKCLIANSPVDLWWTSTTDIGQIAGRIRVGSPTSLEPTGHYLLTEQFLWYQTDGESMLNKDAKQKFVIPHLLQRWT